MARINRVEKSRSEYKCRKCGKVIPAGSSYLWAKPRQGSKIIRCTSCGLRGWETSSSDYILSVGALVEDWEETYGVSEDTVENIKGELETLLDDCESSLENIPDSLQDSSTGELLQERIDELEDAISNLENIDYDSFFDDAEPDEATENFTDEVNDALGSLTY